MSWQDVRILLAEDGDPYMPWKDVGMLLADGAKPHMPWQDLWILLADGTDPHMPWQDMGILFRWWGGELTVNIDWWRAIIVQWTKCKWCKEYENGRLSLSLSSASAALWRCTNISAHFCLFTNDLYTQRRHPHAVPQSLTFVLYSREFICRFWRTWCCCIRMKPGHMLLAVNTKSLVHSGTKLAKRRN